MRIELLKCIAGGFPPDGRVLFVPVGVLEVLDDAYRVCELR